MKHSLTRFTTDLSALINFKSNNKTRSVKFFLYK